MCQRFAYLLLKGVRNALRLRRECPVRITCEAQHSCILPLLPSNGCFTVAGTFVAHLNTVNSSGYFRHQQLSQGPIDTETTSGVAWIAHPPS